MLKIKERKSEIIDAVKNNDTVIIKSETGTGKTTQIPQFLYDAGMKVIVVEPKSIEATQAYEYVLKQRGITEKMNMNIGCKTKKLHKNVTNYGILYCTGGFNVVSGMSEKELSDIVLIIDEAHEWRMPQEILMGWVNKYRADGHKLKIVFMSASINPDELVNYYKDLSSVKVIEVKGHQFPVKRFSIVGYENGIDVAVKKASEGKSSLFFCSGKKEIERTITLLEGKIAYAGIECEIVPLYGALTYAEQDRAFAKTDNPRIIVCTNIAQSGITPPIQVVIDNGKEKQMRSIDGVDTLVEVLISEEDRNQRAGRAGRVEDGEYYCIENATDVRTKYPIPEIQRVSLDRTIMSLINMGINPLEMKFFHQPSQQAFDDAYILLEDLGALKNDEITEVGKKMIDLPTSMSFARILVEANKRGCMVEAIKAVAIMETGSLLKDTKGFEYFVGYKDFTDKYIKSDVIAEIDIFDKIYNFEYGKEWRPEINKRNFFSIRNRVRNLRKILKDQGYTVTSTSNDDKDLISCLFSGMHMSLMRMRGWNCYSTTGSYAFKDWKGSSVSMLYEFDIFCIGIRKILKTDCQETLLSLYRTVITKEGLISLVNEFFPDELYEEDIFNDYFPDKKTICYDKNLCFREFVIETDTIIENVTEDLYTLFKNEIIDAEKRDEEWKMLKKESDNRRLQTGLGYSLIFETDSPRFRIADDTSEGDVNPMTEALKKAGLL